MRNVTVACVGKLKEAYLRDACMEYQKRLGGFCRLSIAEVDEKRLPERPSQAEIDNGIAAEGRRLLEKTPPGSIRVALCIEGEMMSSQKLCTISGRAGIGRSGGCHFLYRRVMGSFRRG